jgi:hypothetical protein
MANKIVLKKSSVASKVPLTTDLEYGELALNYADGKLYYKNSSNLIKAFSSTTSGGGGSVVPVTISTTPPVGVDGGTLWWNSEEANLYVFYEDGDSAQWVTAARGAKGDKGDPGTSGDLSTDAYILQGTTTNATETELFVDGESDNRIVIPTDTSVYYNVELVCKRTNGVDFAAISLKGMAANTGGTTEDIGSIYEVITVRTDVGISVDTRVISGTNTLGLFVTGVAGKNFSWKANVTLVGV